MNGLIQPRWLFLYLWIAPHLLLGVLAFMMSRRKLVRVFPAFFTYVVYEVVLFVILFSMDLLPAVSADQYATAFYVGNAGSIALRFAVVYEIFNHLFGGYSALKALGAIIFRWATVVLMIVAVILVAYTSGDVDRYSVPYIVVDRAVSIIQCGLLILLMFLARFLSFPWTGFGFGITLGLGLFASAELATTAFQARFGIYFGWNILPLITMAVYHCCAVFWVVSLMLPERNRSGVTAASGYELDRWNDALQRFLQS